MKTSQVEKLVFDTLEANNFDSNEEKASIIVYELKEAGLLDVSDENWVLRYTAEPNEAVKTVTILYLQNEANAAFSTTFAKRFESRNAALQFRDSLKLRIPWVGGFVPVNLKDERL